MSVPKSVVVKERPGRVHVSCPACHEVVNAWITGADIDMKDDGSLRGDVSVIAAHFCPRIEKVVTVGGDAA